MQFGVAEYTPIKGKSLGLVETRKIVAALAASASSLGDLGVGGTFVNPVNNPGAIVLFVLPKGDKASILKGTLMKRSSQVEVLLVRAPSPLILPNSDRSFLPKCEGHLGSQCVYCSGSQFFICTIYFAIMGSLLSFCRSSMISIPQPIRMCYLMN